MLSAGDNPNVYLAPGFTDMRKSIDGLAAMVNLSFGQDLFSNSLFVFCNRRGDKIKILYWEHNGFWLCYRRLERGKFSWPTSAEGGALTINRRQLQWLLDGLAITQPKAHRPVNARIVA